MAQNLVTTLLHKTICEIIFQMLYDYQWSQGCYIPFEKNDIFPWASQGIHDRVCGNSLSCQVCPIHDCARVANGEPSKITNWQVFFEKQNNLFVFSGISIYPGFLKGLICLIFHFTGFMHLSQCIIVLILPFPRVLHYKSLAENP